jgi:hypothetical protein
MIARHVQHSIQQSETSSFNLEPHLHHNFRAVLTLERLLIVHLQRCAPIRAHIAAQITGASVKAHFSGRAAKICTCMHSVSAGTLAQSFASHAFWVL